MSVRVSVPVTGRLAGQRPAVLPPHGQDEQRTTALRDIPVVPRVLFRLIWWPAYRKRFVNHSRSDAVLGPNPRRVLS